MRAQMYSNMRQALKDGLAIEHDIDLMADLTGVEYGFNAQNKIKLEPKEDMKKRGLSSPDRADALALCFAYPVGRRDRHKDSKDKGSRPSGLVTDHEEII